MRVNPGMRGALSADYDPRQQSWYASSSVLPLNAVIIIDTSASMNGSRCVPYGTNLSLKLLLCFSSCLELESVCEIIVGIPVPTDYSLPPPLSCYSSFSLCPYLLCPAANLLSFNPALATRRYLLHFRSQMLHIAAVCNGGKTKGLK